MVLEDQAWVLQLSEQFAPSAVTSAFALGQNQKGAYCGS